MSEQETYEALKEILPQLQSKLRQNIELQFQDQLKKMQLFYKKYAEDIVTKRQSQIRREFESAQTHLRRQLSLIQRQRQQWLLLEQNYRKTIFELSQKINQSHTESDISALTEIVQQNTAYDSNKSQIQVSSWKKRSKHQTVNQRKSEKKDPQSIFNANVNMIKQLKQTQNQNEEISEDRPLKGGDSKKRWKIGEKSVRGEDDDQRGKRQDTMVLSPPKMDESKSMKNSLLQPPSQNLISKPSIFWNEQGKKKLLSMIRSIK